MERKKIIVAHPGKQHSFQMAAAVKESGCLYKYITMVYYRDGSLTKFVTDKFLKGKDKNKAQTHATQELNDDEVLQFDELLGLMTLLMSRIGFLKNFASKWNFWAASHFYKKVMKYAKKNNVDAVIVYDGCSAKHFE